MVPTATSVRPWATDTTGFYLDAALAGGGTGPLLSAPGVQLKQPLMIQPRAPLNTCNGVERTISSKSVERF